MICGCKCKICYRSNNRLKYHIFLTDSINQFIHSTDSNYARNCWKYTLLEITWQFVKQQQPMRHLCRWSTWCNAYWRPQFTTITSSRWVRKHKLSHTINLITGSRHSSHCQNKQIKSNGVLLTYDDMRSKLTNSQFNPTHAWTQKIMEKLKQKAAHVKKLPSPLVST